MKRDKNLIPFSHDHHQGLVFVLRIKKGIENAIVPTILRDFIQDFWQNHLSHHFDEEERLLLPRMSDNHELTIKFRKDHGDIRKLIDGVASPVDKNFNDIAADLADRIEMHIRFEERQLFPFLEKSLDPDQLAYVGKGLENHPDACHNFKPEFWKE